MANNHKNAELINNSIREHWGIENKLHWSLDVTFREDESRKRAGKTAKNFTIVRRIALNLLRTCDDLKISLKRKRLKAGWDEGYLRNILKIYYAFALDSTSVDFILFENVFLNESLNDTSIITFS